MSFHFLPFLLDSLSRGLAKWFEFVIWISTYRTAQPTINRGPSRRPYSEVFLLSEVSYTELRLYPFLAPSWFGVFD